MNVTSIKYFARQTLTTLDRKCISEESNPDLPCDRREFYLWTTIAIKDDQGLLEKSHKSKRKKRGNVDALNFGGAMEQLVQGYNSVVELSTADRMISASNPDVPCLLGIGDPCKWRQISWNNLRDRLWLCQIVNAQAGNQTPVSRVAGENSTTESPMRQGTIKASWTAATNAKKKMKKKMGKCGCFEFWRSHVATC